MNVNALFHMGLGVPTVKKNARHHGEAMTGTGSEPTDTPGGASEYIGIIAPRDNETVIKNCTIQLARPLFRRGLRAELCASALLCAPLKKNAAPPCAGRVSSIVSAPLNDLSISRRDARVVDWGGLENR